MSWETVVAEVRAAERPVTHGDRLREQLIDAVARLEQIEIQELLAPARASGAAHINRRRRR